MMTEEELKRRLSNTEGGWTEQNPKAHTTLNLFIKGILIGEDLVPLEKLRTETVVPNTTIQLRKLQDKP